MTLGSTSNALGRCFHVWNKTKIHLKVVHHLPSLCQLNLEAIRLNGSVELAMQVPTDLVKSSVKEHWHMGFMVYIDCLVLTACIWISLMYTLHKLNFTFLADQRVPPARTYSMHITKLLPQSWRIVGVGDLYLTSHMRWLLQMTHILIC